MTDAWYSTKTQTWQGGGKPPFFYYKGKGKMHVNLKHLKNKYELNGRGFYGYRFKDRYLSQCSIQDSSSAEEPSIWLGVDTDFNGRECTRMHLNAEMAEDLITLLNYFVLDGQLPRSENVDADSVITDHAFCYSNGDAGTVLYAKGEFIEKAIQIVGLSLNALDIGNCQPGLWVWHGFGHYQGPENDQGIVLIGSYCKPTDAELQRLGSGENPF